MGAGIDRSFQMVIVIVLVLLAFFITPSAAISHVIEKGSSNNDLDLKDINLFLTGSSDEAGTNVKQSILADPNKVQNSMGSAYGTTYDEFFMNDPLFGDFMRVFRGGLTPAQMNLTWREGLLLMNPNYTLPGAQGPSNQHRLKPILINEPSF